MSKSNSYILGVFLFLGLLFAPSLLFGQFGTSNRSNPESNSRPEKNGTSKVSTLDTSIFIRYSLDDIDRKENAHVDNLDDFHRYEPASNGFVFQGNLGNAASASRNLFYTPNAESNTPWFLGARQFNHLYKSRNEVDFYQLNRPYSNFRFTPSGGVNNFLFQGAFSRNFANNVNFTIALDRILRDGSYTSQANKSTNLRFGFHKMTKSLEFFFTGVFNAHNEESNGGVSDFTDLEDEFGGNRSTISTNISGANTRLADTDLAMNAYWHSYDTEKIKLSLQGELFTKNGTYKYSDPYVSANFTRDSTFYHPNWSDLGGRVFVKHSAIGSSFTSHFSLKKKFKAKAGLSYVSRIFDYEFEDKHQNELVLSADLKYHLSPSIQIEGQLQKGLNDINQTSLLHTEVKYRIGEKFGFHAGARRENARIESLYNQAYFSNESLWTNEFKSPIIDQIWFGIDLSGNNKLVAKYIQIKNALFYDWQSLASQESEKISVFQFLVDGTLDIGKFHVDSELGFQAWSKNVYQLPRIIAENDIYIETRLFKKRMLARFGVDIRYTDDFFPSSYNPALGVFYQQSEYEISNYIMIDPYISFMIDQFRAFFKYEKVNAFFLEPIQVLTNNYPQFDPIFRLGIGWQLAD